MSRISGILRWFALGTWHSPVPCGAVLHAIEQDDHVVAGTAEDDVA
jgi:hypothetical protein